MSIHTCKEGCPLSGHNFPHRVPAGLVACDDCRKLRRWNDGKGWTGR